MSVLSFNAVPNAAVEMGFSRRLHRVAVLLRAFSAEWRARRAERQVGALDDATLHDIGITRGEIARAVRFGRGCQ